MCVRGGLPCAFPGLPRTSSDSYERALATPSASACARRTAPSPPAGAEAAASSSACSSRERRRHVVLGRSEGAARTKEGFAGDRSPRGAAHLQLGCQGRVCILHQHVGAVRTAWGGVGLQSCSALRGRGGVGVHKSRCSPPLLHAFAPSPAPPRQLTIARPVLWGEQPGCGVANWRGRGHHRCRCGRPAACPAAHALVGCVCGGAD